MTALSEERLQEIEAREKAATPGAWEAPYGQWCVVAPDIPGFPGVTGDAKTGWCPPATHSPFPSQIAVLNDGEYIENPNAAADAVFIAHARKDVPDLLAEIRRLQAKLAQVDELCRLNYAMADTFYLQLEKRCSFITAAGEPVHIGFVYAQPGPPSPPTAHFEVQHSEAVIEETG